MGVFPSTPPSTDSVSVNMIASFDYEPKGHYVVKSTSLIPHKAMQDAIQTYSDDHTDDLHLVALDPYHLPYWLEPSLPTLDYLSETFPFDESIIEIMSTDESIWEDHHHRSMFLPNTSLVNHDYAFLLILSTYPKVPYCCKTQILKKTFATLLRQIQLTYQPSLIPSIMFMLGRTARQMNLKHTRHFSKNSVIFSPSRMKKYWGQTHPLWSMKLKPIPRINLSGKN